MPEPMTDAKPMYLHAGAHRTGTSSFQMMLSANRAALEAAGFDVTYPERDGIADGTLGLRLPSPRNADQVAHRFAPSVREEIAGKCRPDSAALILSEENILGRMIHFASGRFYPAAEARFETLATGTGAPILRILLVVRDYAELYVSAFRKRAEDNLVDPFLDGRPRMMRMDRGWPELVIAMQSVLRPREIVVVEYRKRGRSIDLMRLLVPDLAAVDLIEPQARVNLSATDAGLEVLQARYAQGESLTREQWQQVIAEHREDTASRGISEFKPRQLAKLRARYAADLDRVQAMKGVTLLR